MDLSAFLTTQFLTVALVFARIGAAMMFIPAFGESFIFVRHRLVAGLLLALVYSLGSGKAFELLHEIVLIGNLSEGFKLGREIHFFFDQVHTT